MEAKAFSSIDLVAQCMADEERSSAFERAISEAVKPGMAVLDVGTGTGLLAMFAARAGAKHVYALEYDPFVAAAARENIKNNGFQDKVTVLEGDATKYKYPFMEPFDVVIMELLTTGMIDEVQVAASNNLHINKIVTENTVFVPHEIHSYASLGYMDFSINGLTMEMVRHLWQGFPDRDRFSAVTEKVLYSSEKFNRIVPRVVDKILTFKAAKNGDVNAICLQSHTFLTPQEQIWDSLAMNAPVVLPIEKIDLKKDDVLTIRLAYEYGAGFSSLKLDILSHSSDRRKAA